MFLKILLFIALKVLEISAIVFVPYWVGRLAYKICRTTRKEYSLPYWPMGVIIILSTMILIVITDVLIIPWFQANWQLVERMVR